MVDLARRYRRRAMIREGAKTLAIASLPVIALLAIVLLTIHLYRLTMGVS